MQNDVRLIDANALKLRAINVSTVRSHTYMKAVGTREIDKAPTIDAVPVVRCRECKNTYDPLLLNEGWIFCTVWKKTTRCDGFCHMGAKMDAKDMDVPTKDGGATDG